MKKVKDIQVYVEELIEKEKFSEAIEYMDNIENFNANLKRLYVVVCDNIIYSDKKSNVDYYAPKMLNTIDELIEEGIEEFYNYYFKARAYYALQDSENTRIAINKALELLEQDSSITEGAKKELKFELEKVYKQCNEMDENFYRSILDDAENHAESIIKKNLPVDKITAYNHIAIYLRWCIENDLVSETFISLNSKIVKNIKYDREKSDLRYFLKNELEGILSTYLFNDEGVAFSKYYYGTMEDEINDERYYPADVDRYAENYFGEEEYNSEKYQDEAYLFVPFNEEYYQGLKKYIDKHYKNFKKEYMNNEKGEVENFLIN